MAPTQRFVERGDRSGLSGTGIGIVLAVVCLLVAGCASTPTPSSGPPNTGVLHYWTDRRLLAAEAFHGPGYRAPSRLASPSTARFGLASIRVGALFSENGNGDHFCTASVVASPDKDLLVTAAHCLENAKDGYAHDIVFIPSYHDGQAPFGIWTTSKLVVAPQWLDDADPDFDVGFVVLNQLNDRNIEDVLGSNVLAVDTNSRYLVRVTGYPSSADAPITCRNWTTSESATQLRFGCDDFTDGTSGSPWVTDFDPHTRNGTIVGVLGGYEQGGDTPAVSYSAVLGSAIQHLYRSAIADSEAGK